MLTSYIYIASIFAHLHTALRIGEGNIMLDLN